MGKRAAAKPKGKAAAKEASAPAAKKPKKGAGVEPPAAPAAWKRPEPKVLDADTQALAFFLVDIEQAGLSESELRLYGVTAEGSSVCVRLQGVRPYFYARCPAAAEGRQEEIRAALDAAVSSTARWNGGAGEQAVRSVELVKKTPLLVFQGEENLMRVTVASPALVNPCAKAVEHGLRLQGTGEPLEIPGGPTWEANIPSVLRFLVDNDLGGGRWMELPAKSYRLKTDARSSNTQLEVDVDLSTLPPDDQARGTWSVSLDTELGSSVPPVRTLAIEVLKNAGGIPCAAACVLSVHGESAARARAVWMLREDATPGADADMTGPDAVKVFVSDSSEKLMEHFGQTLEALDADILLTHDLSKTMQVLLGPKAVAKAGSALARGICRRLTAELKITARSNEVSGLSGRLGFDLQKQVQKDHPLVDYSLGFLLDHFCRKPLPELRESTLTRLLAERPRTFAQQLLQQATADLDIFDQLAYLFNFVEMARVTGCPLSYLLERGQAVKVQAQLLREANLRGFVLPSQRPGTGEESTFEGATVLQPTVGFYHAPVAVLDFASLYPSIMIAHNLCYSTLLPANSQKRPETPEHSLSPVVQQGGPEGESGGQQHCFVTPAVRKGLLPSILEKLLSARKAAKKQLAACQPEEITRRKVLNGRQLALKLSANSVYGFTGATNGPLPCLELAGAVTAHGREMIQATKKHVEAHFCKANGYSSDAEVLYGDTDSVMVKFGTDDTSLAEAMKLSEEAAKLCSGNFPAPVRLEFEKVYRPFLLMAKKRYAGLAWTSEDCTPAMENKGLETVRRDWSDLVRQGLGQTLQLLLRADNADGKPSATAYVQGLCEDLRQNKVDYRSLVLSKSLGKDEYASKTPHMEVAEKMRKRNPADAPRLGDRVSYLVLAGAAKTKVYERAEDPAYALENDLPIDAEYYLDNQLKQPLLRVFEHVCGSVEKAEQALFVTGPGQKVVAVSASSKGGMGKFMKPKPKCLDCEKAFAKSDKDAFCTACEAKGEARAKEVRDTCIKKAQGLREELATLRKHCEEKCKVAPGDFPSLPADAGSANGSHEAGGKEQCDNTNCQVIFRRARTAKELATATAALVRLQVKEW
eukprot:TRINITY_DN110757_c0_g1_i1.p1 TRINITY_DN110757_c0_g1~~TRINITY_DN110757_c0_g1_i1.p1  ORF type:complete len:1097 (+),score=285.80 TRINITY_DN110757_c0_g1_i1:70-3360(+)